jgi:DNA polymerase elongation subunit (family B)
VFFRARVTISNTCYEEGTYKTVTGKPAKKMEYSKWSKFKDDREKFREYGVKLYESDISLQTKFIASHYLGQELKTPKEFNIFYLDIEVHLETGFPRPEDAEGKITVITIFSTRDKKFYIFAEKDFNASFITEQYKCEYQKRIHRTEESLLEDFINFIYHEHPDIISGWNSQDYDIPYIINRTKKILSPEHVNRLSPVGNIREEEVRDKKQGIMRKQYFISGINCIDLMEVYKNYSPSIKSSYALGVICKEEIGVGKLEYEGTLVDLYNDWQKYMEYNIQDVDLLTQLDNKLGYMGLLITFCYGCRVPFEHYSKTTRVLDGAFISKLIEENIVLPDVNRKLIEDMKKLYDAAEAGSATEEQLNTINSSKYVGGYVADPIKGAHEWIESFDATSLYPSIMMGWNISPETKLGTIQDGVDDVYACIHGDTTNEEKQIPITIGSKQSVTNVGKIAKLILKNNYCLAANGTFYRQDFVGVIPKFVTEWFNARKKYKNMMMDCKKKGDKDGEQYYNLLQWNFKILINSVYGYLGTKFSRFYDIDNARAVTLTGQQCLKRTMNKLSQFFSTEWAESELGKKLNASNFKDVIIYGDTDSVYVSAGNWLKSISYKDNTDTFSTDDMNNLKIEYKVDAVNQIDDNIKFVVKDKTISHLIAHERVINLLNNTFEPFVQDLVENNMINYSEKTANCRKNTISFKRESICKSVIFVEKKKYAMWLLNDEGNVPADKLKVTGLDIVRSSTPMIAKKVLKDMVFDMLRKLDRDHTVKQIRETRDKFLKAEPHEIARYAPVNGLTKYKDKFDMNNGKFVSTPIHVRAAMIYNMLLNERSDLQNKYDFVYNGDKVMHIALKENKDNPYDVIAFKNKWVPEFGLIIDREQQFEVGVLNLMTKLFELVGWDLPKFDCHEFKSIFTKK